MNETKTKPPYNVLLAVLVTAFAIFAGIFYGPAACPIDETIDNYIVSMITNGLFSTNNYCFSLSPILCLLIKLIKLVLPAADGFVMYCRAAVWASIFISSFASFHAVKTKHQKALLVFVWLFIASVNITNTNFMVISAFIDCCGFFVTVLAIRANSLLLKLCGILLIIAGCLLRINAIVTIIPFIFIYILAALISSSKDNRRAHIKKTLIPAAVCFLCIISLRIVYIAVNTSAMYKDGWDYNEARSLLVDLPEISVEEIVGRIPDVTENDIYMTWYNMLGDTERINTKWLSDIGALSRTYPYSFSADSAKKAFNDFWKFRRSIKLNFIIICDLLFILYIRIFCIDKKYTAAAAVSFLGIFAEAFAFLLYGRLVERLYTSAALGCFFLCLAVICSTDMQRAKNNGKRTAAALAVFGALCVLGSLRYFKTDFSPTPVLSVNATKNADDSFWKSTFEGSNIFIWQVIDYDQILLNGFKSNGKLPTEECMQHHTIFGEWTYGQPYMKDYFNKIGIKNPVYDLIYRQNTYFVCSQDIYTQMVLTYIHEHIDPSVQAVRCGSIGPASIWQFVPSVK
ncbi:MAG: hypothetical protein IJR59_07725 [Firmicutes bacterium]|nr:hypothetical protein [Bacillota bacterium]